ncbi:hypothetical protein P9112_007051 [Eukaryota sp. TZLM1-RC]
MLYPPLVLPKLMWHDSIVQVNPIYLDGESSLSSGPLLMLEKVDSESCPLKTSTTYSVLSTTVLVDVVNSQLHNLHYYSCVRLFQHAGYRDGQYYSSPYLTGSRAEFLQQSFENNRQYNK